MSSDRIEDVTVLLMGRFMTAVAISITLMGREWDADFVVAPEFIRLFGIQPAGR
jgi:hypothetical protein